METTDICDKCSGSGSVEVWQQGNTVGDWLEFHYSENCPVCRGSGRVPHGTTYCRKCGGHGWVPTPDGDMVTRPLLERCAACHGRGASAS